MIVFIQLKGIDRKTTTENIKIKKNRLFFKEKIPASARETAERGRTGSRPQLTNSCFSLPAT